MNSPAKPSPATPAAASRRYLHTHREHHERMMPYVDALPELAEMLGRSDPAAFSERLEHECQFILGEMLPHIVTIEETLYPQLDQLMDKRHSMQPMREEHARLRALVEALCRYRLALAGGQLDEADAISLRRILYRLYALVKVHLAEEELYLGVIDRDLSDEERDHLARRVDHASAEPV
jgi:hypothetical protein